MREERISSFFFSSMPRWLWMRARRSDLPYTVGYALPEE